MDLGLNGKVAVVTGGSRGIGRATALTFAEEGADVAICARGSDTLEETLAEVRAHGTNAFGMAVDVTKRDEVEASSGRAPRPWAALTCLSITSAVPWARG